MNPVNRVLSIDYCQLSPVYQDLFIMANVFHSVLRQKHFKCCVSVPPCCAAVQSIEAQVIVIDPDHGITRINARQYRQFLRTKALVPGSLVRVAKTAVL